MKQVVQPLRGGPIRVLDVPRPTIGATEVLVRTLSSVISPGTEKAVTSLARSSLLGKAKARPDLVRQVVAKARSNGVSSAAKAVISRLDSDTPLGYSASGIALEVGEAVSGIRPGMLVATGGAGRANHAEFQAVPGLLCTPVPEGVSAQDAAFATLGSIALHGVRLAEVGPGSKVVVVGLGLVGQLAARLLLASGCDVAGIDVAEQPLATARASGVYGLREEGEETTDAVLTWTRGRGADAVLLCASGASSEAVNRTPALCRDRAAVVVVGDVGLDIARKPFYERELSVRFARSYGPGRYERSYEEYGVDFPAGHVRWTEGRNLEAVLDLLASRRITVDDLVTHRFEIGEAGKAYQLIESGSEPYLAVQLRYPDDRVEQGPVRLRQPSTRSGSGVGWLGAGSFSTSVLLPAFRQAGFERFVSVASAQGLSARKVAERFGFEQAVSEPGEVIDDPAVDVVVIATPHDTHAELVLRALRAGKHVWCEKPPVLTVDEAEELTRLAGQSPGVLFIGYNRRWSPALAAVKDHLGEASPRTVVYRVAAGELPGDHWYHDRRQGGRLRGEMCHFVDTCCALTGSAPEVVSAVAGSTGELGLADDVGLLIRHRDGSVSTVSYCASSPAGAGKERVEVLAGDRHAVIEDYRRIVLDGRRRSWSTQDKGHKAAVSAFHAAVRESDNPAVTEQLLLSTNATLAALRSIHHVH